MKSAAVFFDVGNTLLFPFPSVSKVCQQILSRAGYECELDAIDAAIPVVDEHYEKRYREDDTFWTNERATADVWIGMYTLLFRKLGIDGDAEELAGRVYDEFGDAERWCAYDDVCSAFERLSERGIKLGIISNWDQRLESILHGLGLTDLLGTVVSSAVVGLRKPDPRIFELACERLGVAPRESVHVGDHQYADILGARSAGMVAVLIDRHDAHDPAHAIATLDDLDDHLCWD